MSIPLKIDRSRVVLPRLALCALILSSSINCQNKSRGDDSLDEGCLEEELSSLKEECDSAGGELTEGADEGLSACEESAASDQSCMLQRDECYATCTTPKIAMCGVDVSDSEISYLLHGSAFFASQQAEEGTSIYRFLVNTLVNMLVRGISFSDLRSAKFPFDRETGTYSMDTGRSTIGVKLTFSEDWGDFSAGDPIPNNVFNPRSYVRNVDIDLGSLTNPRFEITYDRGPLFDLIDGEIEFDGRSLSSLSAKVKVKAHLISFELESISRKTFELPDSLWLPMFTTEYSWELFQRTSPIVVTEFTEALRDGRFKIDWSESHLNQKFQLFDKTYLESDDTFSEAVFTLSEDDEGGMISGDYRSHHKAKFNALGIKREGELYTDGFLSSREANYTEFFCDDDLSEPWGRAEHNLELTGGVLTMQDGAEVKYGVERVPR